MRKVSGLARGEKRVYMQGAPWRLQVLTKQGLIQDFFY